METVWDCVVVLFYFSYYQENLWKISAFSGVKLSIKILWGHIQCQNEKNEQEVYSDSVHILVHDKWSTFCFLMHA